MAHGTFRLPGYGGAAVFLRPHAAARTLGSDAPNLAFDVGLLGPDRFAWYLGRPAEDDFLQGLATFLFRAASDFHPERSLPPFEDRRMGFVAAVRSSTDHRVELDVLLGEEDGLNFETSRVVVGSAAHAIVELTGGRVELGSGL
ncbi:hypothetical protein GQ85_17630 [Rhodococcus rhodochrous]|nr:hypothetical protein GQ85_17630 [Rhodococcus rhodochrous]